MMYKFSHYLFSLIIASFTSVNCAERPVEANLDNTPHAAEISRRLSVHIPPIHSLGGEGAEVAPVSNAQVIEIAPLGRPPLVSRDPNPVGSARAGSLGDSVAEAVEPAYVSGLRNALRNPRFVSNILEEPSPLVYNSRRCCLVGAQLVECGIRPIAFFGAASAAVCFILAGTVDPAPFLQSQYFTHGAWIAALSCGVALIKQGAPNLVRDLQNWISEVDAQRRDRALIIALEEGHSQGYEGEAHLNVTGSSAV